MPDRVDALRLGPVERIGPVAPLPPVRPLRRPLTDDEESGQRHPDHGETVPREADPEDAPDAPDEPARRGGRIDRYASALPAGRAGNLDYA